MPGRSCSAGDARAGCSPGERAPGVLGGADVEPAVDEHLEAEAGAGVDVGRAQPAHAAVGELDEPDARELGDAADERAAARPFRNDRPKMLGM